jgi:(S)-2-hydroxyglutarate dehydrogenase
MSQSRFLIVGGGLVGLATAYRLTEHWPDAQVALLEKEAGVGRHQSSHNSGVLHCGLNYKPGSYRARLAVRGLRQMVAFCQEYGIRHEICGKLVIATTEAELPRIPFLHDRGTQNGLRGLEILDSPQIREIEPQAGGIKGLRVPEEGIADYPAVSATLARILSERGVRIVTQAEVRALQQADGGWVAQTTAGDFAGSFLITCAGLHSDRIAALAGERSELRIVPFRGDYYKLRPASEHLVRHLIYPVPDAAFPFLGVHLTRLVRGGIEAGPNAVLALRREGYRKTDVSLRDAADSLSFPGLWNFLKRHPRMCWDEQRRAFSKNLFTRALQRLVPAIAEQDLEPGGAGVRAQAMRPDGTLYEDFAFIERPTALHVINAPSPAATASLAIGEEVVGRIAALLPAQPGPTPVSLS